MNKDSSNQDMLRSVIDAFPALVLVVDDDVRIQDYNAAAAEFLSVQKSAIIKQRGGDVLHCIHAAGTPEGCGHGAFCKDCIIRNSVAEAIHGKRVARRRTRIEIIREGNKAEIYALITASPFRHKEKPLALVVVEDISEIAELRRLIPICSVCKNVRDEKESWYRLEAYFKQHWDVDFSHGLCPECCKIEMDKLGKRNQA